MGILHRPNAKAGLPRIREAKVAYRSGLPADESCDPSVSACSNTSVDWPGNHSAKSDVISPPVACDRQKPCERVGCPASIGPAYWKYCHEGQVNSRVQRLEPRIIPRCNRSIVNLRDYIAGEIER